MQLSQIRSHGTILKSTGSCKIPPGTLGGPTAADSDSLTSPTSEQQPSRAAESSEEEAERSESLMSTVGELRTSNSRASRLQAAGVTHFAWAQPVSRPAAVEEIDTRLPAQRHFLWSKRHTRFRNQDKDLSPLTRLRRSSMPAFQIRFRKASKMPTPVIGLQPQERVQSVPKLRLSKLAELTPEPVVQRRSYLPLHPHSRFKVGWDIVSMVFLMYNVVIVPWRLCFSVFTWCPDPLWFFEAFIDIFFLFDMALQFVTAEFYSGGDSGLLEEDLRKLAVRYLKTWFFTDLVSSLPIDMITSLLYSPCLGEDGSQDNEGISALKMVRILRMAKLLKLFRLLRVNEFVENIQDYFPINKNSLQLLSLTVSTLYIAHIIASAWWAVGVAASGQGNNNSWVEQEGLMVDEERTIGLGRAYIASLYWAMTTLSTVGYGDIIPESEIERGYAVCAMLVGATVFGYVMGNITTIVSQSNARVAQLNQKFELLNQYMLERALPLALQVRIRRYFRYYWSRRSVFTNEDEILSGLSSNLRDDVLRYIHREVIQLIPLFNTTDDPGFIDIMVRTMKPMFCSAGDYIIVEGKLGAEMYWLISGKAEVLSYLGNTDPGAPLHKLCDMGPGYYFGEIALMSSTVRGLKSNRRTASVRAVDFCDLQSVSKEAFLQALDEFPEVHDEVVQLALKRFRTTTEMSHSDARSVSAAGGSMHSARSSKRESGCLLASLNTMKKALISRDSEGSSENSEHSTALKMQDVDEMIKAIEDESPFHDVHAFTKSQKAAKGIRMAMQVLGAVLRKLEKGHGDHPESTFDGAEGVRVTGGATSSSSHEGSRSSRGPYTRMRSVTDQCDSRFPLPCLQPYLPDMCSTTSATPGSARWSRRQAPSPRVGDNAGTCSSRTSKRGLPKIFSIPTL